MNQLNTKNHSLVAFGPVSLKLRIKTKTIIILRSENNLSDIFNIRSIEYKISNNVFCMESRVCLNKMVGLIKKRFSAY